MLLLGITESDIRCLEWLNDYIVNVVNLCALSDKKINYEKSLLKTKKHLNNRMSTSTLLGLIMICGITFWVNLFVFSFFVLNIIFVLVSLGLGYYCFDKLAGMH